MIVIWPCGVGRETQCWSLSTGARIEIKDTPTLRVNFAGDSECFTKSARDSKISPVGPTWNRSKSMDSNFRSDPTKMFKMAAAERWQSYQCFSRLSFPTTSHCCPCSSVKATRYNRTPIAGKNVLKKKMQRTIPCTVIARSFLALLYEKKADDMQYKKVNNQFRQNEHAYRCVCFIRMFCRFFSYISSRDHVCQCLRLATLQTRLFNPEPSGVVAFQPSQSRVIIIMLLIFYFSFLL